MDQIDQQSVQRQEEVAGPSGDWIIDGNKQWFIACFEKDSVKGIN